MQWDDSLPNAGFSSAEPDALYLPQDSTPGRPTVAAQRHRPDSLLRFVRALIELRREVPARTSASRTVLAAGHPFVYLRGDDHLVVVNPRREPAWVEADALAGRTLRRLVGSGVTVANGVVASEGLGHGVFELLPRPTPGPPTG